MIQNCTLILYIFYARLGDQKADCKNNSYLDTKSHSYNPKKTALLRFFYLVILVNNINSSRFQIIKNDFLSFISRVSLNGIYLIPRKTQAVFS